MNNDIIFMICVLCVLVLIAVIAVQFVLLYVTRKTVNEQQDMLDQHRAQIGRMSDDMEFMLNKISDGVKYKIDSSLISILDLAEFKDLDPILKDKYAEYIKDLLAPAIMEGINKTMKDNKLDDYLKRNDKQIHEAVYSMAQDIRKNGFNTIALQQLMKQQDKKK